MKKFWVMLMAVAAGVLLNGCGYFSQYDNFDNSARLRTGMSMDEVRSIMGEPLDATFSKPDVWFYYIETRWHDGQSTIDECMPLVFENGKLAGWGKNYYTDRELNKRTYERPQIDGLK